MLAGGLGYLWLMLWRPDPDGAAFFGTEIYDYYFLALAEGRFDIPVRIAGLEGHYDAGGRAYVYHGIGPLIYRAALYPFVDLVAFPVHLVSIWVSTVIGTVFWHLSLLGALGPRAGTAARTMVGLAVWTVAPGVLLVTNGSVFQEPVAFAYAATGWFVWTMTGIVLRGRDPAAGLVALAVAAGLVLFARPHLAVGLYAGTVAVAGLVLWRTGARRLGRVAGAMAILGRRRLSFMKAMKPPASCTSDLSPVSRSRR